MENLSNDQIIDIINFYKLCGISEDMYLSRNGVKDIFSLLGVEPKFDENGKRISTVYEDLGIPPKFEDGKEVPIVFAIKHHVSKVHKPKTDAKVQFTFVGGKELSDEIEILNKFKRDYFSAVSSGNLIEASKLYDLIDQLTAGGADEFIGVNYNCVKFYKRMQRQLMMDIFANFMILRMLSKKTVSIKEGLIEMSKRYRLYMVKDVKDLKFGFVEALSFELPRISKIVIQVPNEDGSYKEVSEESSTEKIRTKKEKQETDDIQVEKKDFGNVMSFINTKIEAELRRIREKIDSKVIKEEVSTEKSLQTEKNDNTAVKFEKTALILEK